MKHQEIRNELIAVINSLLTREISVQFQASFPFHRYSTQLIKSILIQSSQYQKSIFMVINYLTSLTTNPKICGNIRVSTIDTYSKINIWYWQIFFTFISIHLIMVNMPHAWELRIEFVECHSYELNMFKFCWISIFVIIIKMSHLPRLKLD